MEQGLSKGVLTPFSKEKLRQSKQVGEDASIGVDAQELLDKINQWEISTGYNFGTIVSQIKMQLMIVLDKITVVDDQEVEEDKE